MVAAAMIGSAALSAGSQLFGASQQAGAANSAIALQQQMFEAMQKLVGPYAAAGTKALPTLESLLGIGGGGSAGIQSTLAGLPGYQFTLSQGLKSLQNQFAARGLGTSGAAAKGAAGYATGLAQSNYGNYLSQLMGLAGMGAGAAESLGGAGLQAGAYEGQTGIQGATALAAGATGAANSIGSGVFNSLLFSNPRLLMMQNPLLAMMLGGVSNMYGNPAGTNAGTANPNLPYA